MPYTTRPPCLDITEAIPELADYARTAVRLHPRRGTPGTSDSHIGGPLLWPADEPWPHCHNPSDYWEPPHKRPVAMVPIAQLYASDITGFPLPEDFDLLQILWCPAHEVAIPDAAFCVRWRRAADVTDVLVAPPPPHLVEVDSIPIPCVLAPEPVSEYPYHEELPRKIQDDLEEWESIHPHAYQCDLSIASGCKVGGGMSFNVTDMGEHPSCEECGSRARLILQLSSTEWDGGSGSDGGRLPRWRPLEDSDLDGDAYWAAREPTGLSIGRYSHGGFYGCSADHRHPVVFHSQ